MSKRLSSANELKEYLEQIKTLERQVENIEARRQIDLREQNRRVESPIREHHRMERRPKNKSEVNATDHQATTRKTTLSESRVNGGVRMNEEGRRPRRSMELFDDIDSQELDEASDLNEERSVNMSHPYGDLLDEEYSRRVFYEPRTVRTKETLRKSEEAGSGDERDYIRRSRPFRQQSERNTTGECVKVIDPKQDEPVGRTRNSLYSTTENQRCELPVMKHYSTRSDTTNDCKPYYIKPPRFDGKGCIEAHITQFNIVANRNKWTEEEKVDFMKISLSGEASNNLS